MRVSRRAPRPPDLLRLDLRMEGCIVDFAKETRWVLNEVDGHGGLHAVYQYEFTYLLVHPAPFIVLPISPTAATVELVVGFEATDALARPTFEERPVVIKAGRWEETLRLMVSDHLPFHLAALAVSG